MLLSGIDQKTTYYKRFRMEIDLQLPFPAAILPSGYRWVPWDDALLETHAEVKFASFHGEIDSAVFPSLADRNGCHYLMTEISRKPGFLPVATWLITGPTGDVGTVQGVIDRGPIGAIQNLGVVPGYRGLGLGRSLIRQALDGFCRAGLRRAYLEVTAENAAAVRLYRSVGFRRAKTLYKAVDG